MAPQQILRVSMLTSPRDSIASRKRQKLSHQTRTSLGERDRRSPSVTSDRVVSRENLSDDNLASDGKGVITTLDAAVGAPWTCLQFVDIAQE